MGVILGKAAGNGNADSMVAGAGIGATLGGLIGADMDRRRCELSKVAKAHNLDIVMTDITLANAVPRETGKVTGTVAAPAPVASSKKPEAVGMSLNIIDRGQQFAIGSASPSADAVVAFGAVADQYHAQATGKGGQEVQVTQVRNKQIRILLIGHTDDTGSSALNADLSEERARAIAVIFSKHGFSAEQIFYQGAGEVFPIQSNATEEGRARNRRVEIVDLSDDASFAAFLASRRPNVAHYRPAAPAKPLQIASSALADSAKAPEIKNPTGSKVPTKASPSVATKTPPAIAIASATTGASAKKPEPGGPSTQARTIAVVQALENIDLGGRLANGQYRSVDIGKTERGSSFSIISSAYATDESPMGSCATDRPRISRGVKSLGTGQVVKTSEYLPGAANASWGGNANGHLVGMSGVSVLRDGGQPASRPEFYVWKNYVEGAKAPPNMKTTADVNAYQGDKALLYRVFLTEGPVRCIDLVIPKGSANSAPASSFVYERNSALYQADYSPTIVR